MTRCVYDIDFVVFVYYRYVFREDGYTSLALDIVIVHDKVAASVFVFTHKVTLHNHLIYKRGLAVVYVSDNCNVA